MAKIFYYDSADMSDAIITAGTQSSSTFSASASAIANEHRINDQSIAEAVSGFNDEDVIRINFGSAKTVDRILYHNNGTVDETDDLLIYYSSSATDIGTAWASNGISPPGWDISIASSQTAQYWYIRSSSGTFTGLTEIIMGAHLDFEVEPDIGISNSEIFGTNINTSLGGIEYAYKKHNPKSVWNINFKNISQTFKDNLSSFEQNVTNFKKFVYYDGTNYNYVRLNKTIRFTEVAFQRYSASIELVEQLS